jgi:hypothetical protein
MKNIRITHSMLYLVKMRESKNEKEETDIQSKLFL